MKKARYKSISIDHDATIKTQAALPVEINTDVTFNDQTITISASLKKKIAEQDWHLPRNTQRDFNSTLALAENVDKNNA